MKKLLIILVCLFITSCVNTEYSNIYDDSKITSIDSIEYGILSSNYKYKITTSKYNGRIHQVGYIHTNKECKVGETIWDCK